MIVIWVYLAQDRIQWWAREHGNKPSVSIRDRKIIWRTWEIISSSKKSALWSSLNSITPHAVFCHTCLIINEGKYYFVYGMQLARELQTSMLLNLTHPLMHLYIRVQ